MCKKHNPRKIDSCMMNIIMTLKMLLSYTKLNSPEIVACCCGHGKYPMTIVIKQKWVFNKIMYYDLMTGVNIPRKKRYYKKDKEGYYYIPETLVNNTTEKHFGYYFLSGFKDFTVSTKRIKGKQ